MDQDLNLIFSALSDPTRRAILSRLSAGEASVGDLAMPFKLGVRTISKHVAVLEQAGLITRNRMSQKRMSKLEMKALEQAEDWLLSLRQMWNARFDQLTDVMAQIQRGELDEPQR